MLQGVNTVSNTVSESGSILDLDAQLMLRVRDGDDESFRLLLEKHRDEFVSTFTEKLMIYALGRGVEAYDMPAMRAIIREAAKRDTTIPALIDAIVKSPQFQMRRTRESS